MLSILAMKLERLPAICKHSIHKWCKDRSRHNILHDQPESAWSQIKIPHHSFQVLDVLQNISSGDLFLPELDDERKLKAADPVTTDLLEALLSVS